MPEPMCQALRDLNGGGSHKDWRQQRGLGSEEIGSIESSIQEMIANG